MANSTHSPLQGGCIAPFLDASLFRDDEGYIAGRFCSPLKTAEGTPSCCLPCPATDWVYDDKFDSYGTIAEALNVTGLVLMVFMLISYAVLPAQKTRSHYLSICLTIAVMMIALGFTIPLVAKPEQCANLITPHDMYSSNECAASGAFIVAGGLSAVMWIFIRALSMNLQICWDIVPGKKFFYVSQAIGWGIPAALFTAVMTATGVSFRFGSACHVNHVNSMADFWGPLIGFSGAAGVLQLMTFGYCIHVYLKNLWTDNSPQPSSNSGSNLPSYQGSIRAQTARAVYQRLKKVLWLQWRGICIVSIILVDVIFFSIVFVYLDGMQQSVTQDWTKVQKWTICLAMHPTDKNACLQEVDGWLVSESTVVAVLILLSLTGIQVFLFLTRPSVFSAWVDFFREKFMDRQEFVSLDATPEIMRSASQRKLVDSYKYNRGHQSTDFEMQKPRDLTLDIDSKTMHSDTVVSSPDESYRSPLHFDRTPDSTSFGRASPMGPGRIPNEYVGRITPITESPAGFGHMSPLIELSPPLAHTSSVRSQQRVRTAQSPDYFGERSQSADRYYYAPHSSFSAPKPPSRASSHRSVTFEQRDVYSRGGLALNPPDEAGESREDLTSPVNQSQQDQPSHRYF
ncbi:hypothetical protein K431DRAFT_220288 [Polychaeton citri CBS 116435]|uniref:G-protein coupled receptors family 2 profile 2 domain-containing protein n=1 Tax=Polychaeton citri CBS 116435 TaxID=1314669 RepID=A0A9P4USL8_9PEZI|nr:hypothetical protein K431DRAFT_220288 [Polychaeton citri CBS 116435]